MKATVELAKTQPAVVPPPSSTAQENRFLNVNEIVNLFQRFKLRAASFEDLTNFPLSLLNPSERNFVRYLLRNPHVFQKLASLDKKSETLSVEDLKIAAGLAGDALTLSEEDFGYLRETTRLEAPSSREQKHYQAQEISDLISKLRPGGMRFEELQAVQAGQLKLTPGEMELLRFLQSRPVQRVLYNVSQPYNGQLTPEVIRILTSLIWNPSIYGAMPIVFMKAPVQDEDSSARPVGPPEWVTLDEGSRFRAAQPRMQIELHADRMIEILNKLSPGDGHVTLNQLRHYQPESQEEAHAINTLKQAKVFRALAGWDGEPETMSAEDIKMAMHEGAILLFDSYLMLVILP